MALPLLGWQATAEAQYRPCYYYDCAPPPPPPPCCYSPPPPPPVVYQPPPVVYQPAPVYQPPAQVAPAPAPVTVVAAPAQDNPTRWALGAFAGGLAQSEEVTGQDFGVLGRFKLGTNFQLEAEISVAQLDEGERQDRRIGAGLLFDLTPEQTISPYIIGAAGFGDADFTDQKLTAAQGYGEIGGGIHLNLTKNLVLAADLRAGARRLTAENTSEMTEISTSEHFARGRVAAFLFF